MLHHLEKKNDALSSQQKSSDASAPSRTKKKSASSSRTIQNSGASSKSVPEGTVDQCAHAKENVTTPSSETIEQDTHQLIAESGHVTDYSWTSQIEGSCWDKFHQFYLPKGLYNACNIDLNQRKIKFGQVNFSSKLYQKKLEALGVEVKKKENFLGE